MYVIRDQIAAEEDWGPGSVMGVDEAKFGKQKYDRGKMPWSLSLGSWEVFSETHTHAGGPIGTLPTTVYWYVHYDIRLEFNVNYMLVKHIINITYIFSFILTPKISFSILPEDCCWLQDCRRTVVGIRWYDPIIDNTVNMIHCQL